MFLPGIVLIVKMTRLKLRTLCKGKALKEMIVVIVTAGSGQWKRNRGRVETCHRPGGRESALLPMSSQREDLQLEGQGLWEGRCWSHTRTVGQVSTLRHHLKPQLMKYAI